MIDRFGNSQFSLKTGNFKDNYRYAEDNCRDANCAQKFDIFLEITDLVKYCCHLLFFSHNRRTRIQHGDTCITARNCNFINSYAAD